MQFLKMSDVTLAGKRVFIRADLNVPQNDSGVIMDDTRIIASIPAIQYALDQGASVMVTSHLGRPTEGHFSPEDSLAPIALRIADLLGRKVPLISNWVENGVKISAGEVVLLENCRINIGEKANDLVLAQKMAKLCDVFVNDAFGTAHRAEATTYGIAKYAPIACAGPLMAAELEALGKAFQNPGRPLVAIVAGFKVSTKLAILKKLSEKVEHLGKSMAEPDLIEEARDIIAIMEKRGAVVLIPEDVIVANEFSSHARANKVWAHEVRPDDMILDIGPRTAAKLSVMISNAGTVVWNGPVGVFEIEQFGGGTKMLAAAIAHSPAFTIGGGGDTLAAISKYEITNQVDYISTGGGAFLEFLEGKILPAVEVLIERAH